jgi:excisionase family DNA binding protein
MIGNQGGTPMVDNGKRTVDPTGLMTIDEVAAYFKVSKHTIYRWRHHRQGPKAVRLGKHLRFRRSDVLGFVDRLEREQEGADVANTRR